MTTEAKEKHEKRSIEQVEAEDEQAQEETRKEELVDKQEDGGDESAGKQEEQKQEVEPTSKKRKTKSTETAEVKQTARRTTRNSKPKPSSRGPKEIIRFLLSDNALETLDQLESGEDTDFHFPRDRLNPFQELIAACMVSKPFSHRVATRAINDLFSKTHSLQSPGDVLQFGHDKVLESLHHSKTLHKDKTTGQIIGIAEVCQSSFDGSSTLASLRDQASHDPAKERDLIIHSFKGYGPKTVDIFFRRVQVDWDEIYPFADAASIKAAREVGLEVDDADELKKVVDEAIEEKDSEKKRLAFARVVDMLVYLGLEKKTEQVESKIAST